jgi:probable rRNA maturation factor
LPGKAKRRIFINKSNILINNSHPSLKAPLTYRSIKSAVKKVTEGENASISSLLLNFVEKKEIKKINNKYLNHNYFTDIITFPYESKKSSIQGEIFMCLDVIKENAPVYNVSYKNEFERVLIHGCLHLTGYNDKTRKQKELIRAKENFYLS